MAELLRVLLWETHDQPEYLQALLPVIVDTCNAFAGLASKKPDVFAAALEPLTQLARQVADKGSEATSAFFAALADNDKIAAEGQVLFCLLTATACQGNRNSEAGERLATRLASAVKQSNVAPVAAQALGNSFAATDFGNVLGQLAFSSKGGKQPPSGSTQRAMLPTRYHEFLRLKQEPDCSGGAPIRRVAVVALVRLDLPHQGSRFINCEILPTGLDDEGAFVEVRLSRPRDQATSTVQISCSVSHESACSSPCPTLVVLPAPDSSTVPLLGQLLRTPTSGWAQLLPTSQFVRPSAFVADQGHPVATGPMVVTNPRVVTSPAFSFQPRANCGTLLISVPMCVEA